MFMTREEIYEAAPGMGELDEKTSDSLLKIMRYLAPTYVRFRLDYIMDFVESNAGLLLPDMRSATGTIRAWNDASRINIGGNLNRLFAAISCFNHCIHFEDVVIGSQLLGDGHDMSGFFDHTTSNMFAKLEDRSQHCSSSATEKWANIKALGENLATLASHFGGEGFLILFPFFELEAMMGKQLVEFHSTAAIWGGTK
ncbi:hypothetical protein NUW58_g1606 [Xylaria curta]|uniref:Uncharacterized protein n=1 Tax=Xylaria curta TaxID=42375 RepID=A0ACC1PJF5_9PEZI|nr:hypothetical protein NUW58_g1606 [Xylaria curta]